MQVLFISLAERVPDSVNTRAPVSKAPVPCEHHTELVFTHQAVSVQKVSKSLLGFPITSQRSTWTADGDGEACPIDLDLLVLNEALRYQVRQSVLLLCKRFESADITSVQLIDGPQPVLPTHLVPATIPTAMGCHGVSPAAASLVACRRYFIVSGPQDAQSIVCSTLNHTSRPSPQSIESRLPRAI